MRLSSAGSNTVRNTQQIRAHPQGSEWLGWGRQTVPKDQLKKCGMIVQKNRDKKGI